MSLKQAAAIKAALCPASPSFLPACDSLRICLQESIWLALARLPFRRSRIALSWCSCRIFRTLEYASFQFNADFSLMLFCLKKDYFLISHLPSSLLNSATNFFSFANARTLSTASFIIFSASLNCSAFMTIL